MTFLTITATVTSISSMAAELHLSSAQLVWGNSSYTLAVAAVVLSSGMLGDRIGRRSAFQTGAALLAAGASLTAVAWGPVTVIGGEAVMGLGAALIVPNSLAVAATAFGDQRRRGRALGIWSACSGIGFAAGPITSGLLLMAFGWRAVFIVNATVAVLVLVAAPLGVVNTRSAGGVLDGPGGLLAAIAVAALVLGVVEGCRTSFGSPLPAISTIVFLLAAVGFVLVERRAASPAVSFRAFASRTDIGALLVAAVALFSFAGVALLATLEMQRAEGLPPLDAGVRLLALTLAFIVTSVLAAGAVDHAGNFAVIMSGLSATLVGTIVLRLTGATTPFVLTGSGLLLIGAGLGLLIAPTTALVIEHAEPAQRGMAGAVVTTMRQIGAALGGSALGVVLTNRVAAHQGHGLSAAATFTSAEHDALFVLVCILATTLVAAGFLLRPRQRRFAAEARPQPRANQQLPGSR